MDHSQQRKSRAIKLELIIAAMIFAVTFLTFWSSRVYQLADSHYSMLLSQSILQHGSFTLDYYAIPPLNPVRRRWGYISNGEIYQLELMGGHIYYYYPPGNSVLSIPYVAVMNALGISAANDDGTYAWQGELRIQRGLAAVLMASLAVLFFFTSRILLSNRWSALIAMGSVLGTQVWSTASRAMWDHTWYIFLLAVVVLMLLAQEAGRRPLNPILTASLLSWMYFVRPTASLPILATTVYILIYHSRIFIWYATTGAVWLAGFVLYSWYHFRQPLPSYYHLINYLTFDTFWMALAGNLVSPARGLIVYVPVLIFVAYLSLRYSREIVFSRLAVLSTGVIVAHLIAISGFPVWWGGFCYGARYTTDLIPWFVLLAILGIKASLEWHEKHATSLALFRWRLQLAIGGTLLALSIVINARGANSTATALWNVLPASVDEHPSRVWDWRHPQFLAN